MYAITMSSRLAVASLERCNGCNCTHQFLGRVNLHPSIFRNSIMVLSFEGCNGSAKWKLTPIN